MCNNSKSYTPNRNMSPIKKASGEIRRGGTLLWADKLKITITIEDIKDGQVRVKVTRRSGDGCNEMT